MQVNQNKKQDVLKMLSNLQKQCCIREIETTRVF